MSNSTKIMMSKAQFLEKHQQKFDKQGLSKAERSNRYRSYTLSFGMKTGGVVGRSKQAAEPYRERRVLNTSYSSFSQCTKDYANALIDPWTVTRPPCVPDNVTLPSFKFGARQRSTFVIGTLGVGYVFVNPYLPYKDVDVTGFFTSSTYASADIEGGGVLGVVPFQNDSPFTKAEFGPLLNQSRLVGCGLRARYTGTEISRSGQAISFRQPTNNDMFYGGSVSESEILTFKETTTNPVDRQWHYAIYRPATPTDLAYSNPTALTANFCLLIAVFGGQPGQSYEFDYVSWFEVVGSNLPNLTRSHADPIGMAAVSMAMPIVQPTRSPTNTLRGFLKEMASGVNMAMSFMPQLPGEAGAVQHAVGNAAAIGSYLL